MNKFVLGVDLDGVVADFTGGFREYVSWAEGITPANLPDPTEWDFHSDAWGIKNRADFMRHLDGAVRHGIFASMKPYAYVSQVLHSLSSQGIHISIVTSRLSCTGTYKQAITDTVQFLDSHDIPYRDILFLEDKERYRFDVMVEDMPRNIQTLQASKRTGDVVIFDQIYNRDLIGTRAHNWPEVRRIVQQKYATWKTKVRADD